MSSRRALINLFTQPHPLLIQQHQASLPERVDRLMAGRAAAVAAAVAAAAAPGLGDIKCFPTCVQQRAREGLALPSVSFPDVAATGAVTRGKRKSMMDVEELLLRGRVQLLLTVQCVARCVVEQLNNDLWGLLLPLMAPAWWVEQVERTGTVSGVLPPAAPAEPAPAPVPVPAPLPMAIPLHPLAHVHEGTDDEVEIVAGLLLVEEEDYVVGEDGAITILDD